MEHHRFPHHLTASGLVVARDHVLLVNHKRIGAWVPPGGHVENGEMPHETVQREVFEETGIVVSILSDRLMPTDGDADAFFLPSPLFVQSVVACENGQRFYHIDMTYLCTLTQFDDETTRPDTHMDELNADCYALPMPVSNHEVNEVRWVKLDNALNLSLAKNVEPALNYLKQRMQAEPLAVALVDKPISSNKKIDEIGDTK